MVIVWSFTLAMMLVAAGDVVGQVCGKERRSHFGVRVVLSLLTAPAVLSVLVAGAALHVLPEQASIVAFVLMILCSPALLLVPSVLYRTPDSAPGDLGGGSDPGQPPSPSDRPSGDLPLPYAEPGRWRVRDHDRPDLHDAKPRRPAREPEREAAPV